MEKYIPTNISYVAGQKKVNMESLFEVANTLSLKNCLVIPKEDVLFKDTPIPKFSVALEYKSILKC